MELEPGRCDFIVPGGLELVGQQEEERLVEGLGAIQPQVPEQLFSQCLSQDDGSRRSGCPGTLSLCSSTRR